MRKKITITYIDDTEEEAYITPNSFFESMIGYGCILENGNKVDLQRNEVRKIVREDVEE